MNKTFNINTQSGTLRDEHGQPRGPTYSSIPQKNDQKFMHKRAQSKNETPLKTHDNLTVEEIDPEAHGIEIDRSQMI
jgi:hypothetical protein